MEFGPANFPAVIDTPIHCRWYVGGPYENIAIEFLFADVPANNTCDTGAKTGNCLAVVQSTRSDIILSTEQIQRVPILRRIAIVMLIVYEPDGFRGFHARLINDITK